MKKFESNLSTVIEELQAKDVELQNQMDNEVSARIGADAKLQGNIEAESAARGIADKELQNKIAAEIVDRTKADQGLQDQITAETANRVKVDKELQVSMNSEASSRSSAVQDLQAQIDALKKAECVPVGAVEYFARAIAPEGWLKADGSAVLRTRYANLFAAIGTLYGAGDGSTTFNVPDLRGEFIRGFDDGRGVDAGRKLGSLQTDGFKNHTHSLSIGKTAQDGKSWWHDTWSFTSGNYYASTTPNVLATGGTETRPRNISLLACIKY